MRACSRAAARQCMRRTAEILRDSASPEPEAIAHHFTQAGLDDLAIEWWGKAGDQALRRSAFQEAIAHLGKAIAMADKAARREAPPAWFRAPNRRRTQLARGLWQRTHRSARTRSGGNERGVRQGTRASGGDTDAPERLAADYGLFVGSLRPRRTAGDEGACGGFPQQTSRRDPIRPKPASPIAPKVSPTGLPESIVDAREHLERALCLLPTRPRRRSGFSLRI